MSGLNSEQNGQVPWDEPASASGIGSGEAPAEAMPVASSVEQPTQTLPVSDATERPTQALPSFEQPLQQTKALPEAGAYGSGQPTEALPPIAQSLQNGTPLQTGEPSETPFVNNVSSQGAGEAPTQNWAQGAPLHNGTSMQGAPLTSDASAQNGVPQYGEVLPQGDASAQTGPLQDGVPQSAAYGEAPAQGIPPYGTVPPQGVPPYGQPNPYAQPGPYGQYNYGTPVPPAANQRYNGLAIAGFICSFFVSLVGLILSIIGLNQIKKQGGKGKGFAIAGIVISAASLVLSAILVIAVIAGGWSYAKNELQNDLNDAKSDYSYSDSGKSGSDGSSDSASGENLDNLDDSLDDTLNDTFDDLAKSDTGVYDSVQAFVDSSEFQKSIQSEADSLSGSGINFAYHVEGDTLVYEYTVSDDYAAAGDAIASSVSAMSDTYQSTANILGTMCKTQSGKASLRVYMHTTSGQSLFDQTWTEK
ncbi:DUF4854 domain-containing protein [Bifidobacterium callitrichidarum]|nr:DUF4854 domain-containing protein [Bifidobacterium callitrichidarum]